jgi:hypothetical protein
VGAEQNDTDHNEENDTNHNGNDEWWRSRLSSWKNYWTAQAYKNTQYP